MSYLIELVRTIFLRPNLLHVAYDSGGHDKPTILLIHGIASSSGVWTPLIKKLDQQKYRVIALDLLGFGKSPKLKGREYCIEENLRSIKRTIRKLKIKKPYIIAGHSMGANIVARFCRENPRQIRAEYLLSLPIYLKNKNIESESTRKQNERYMKLYAFMLDNKNFTINTAQTIRKILGIKEGIDVTAENWEAFSQSMISMIINQNTIEDIRNTKNIPVQVIYGALDEFLVQGNFKLLGNQKNVKVSKVLADHQLNFIYAKFIASQIEEEYNKVL